MATRKTLATTALSVLAGGILLLSGLQQPTGTPMADDTHWTTRPNTTTTCAVPAPTGCDDTHW